MKITILEKFRLELIIITFNDLIIFSTLNGSIKYCIQTKNFIYKKQN